MSDSSNDAWHRRDYVADPKPACDGDGSESRARDGLLGVGVASDSPSQPLAELIAEVDAAVAQMTPGIARSYGPFPYAGLYMLPSEDHPSDDDPPPPCVARGTLSCRQSTDEDLDIAGIVALRNAWLRVSRELKRLQERRLGHSRLPELLQAENAQLRATLTRTLEDLTCSCPDDGMTGKVPTHYPDCIIAEVRRVLGEHS